MSDGFWGHAAKVRIGRGLKSTGSMKSAGIVNIECSKAEGTGEGAIFSCLAP
jgi:hypothetical protein